MTHTCAHIHTHTYACTTTGNNFIWPTDQKVPSLSLHSFFFFSLSSLIKNIHFTRNHTFQFCSLGILVFLVLSITLTPLISLFVLEPMAFEEVKANQHRHLVKWRSTPIPSSHILTYSHTHILTYSHTHILTYSHTHSSLAAVGRMLKVKKKRPRWFEGDYSPTNEKLIDLTIGALRSMRVSLSPTLPYPTLPYPPTPYPTLPPASLFSLHIGANRRERTDGGGRGGRGGKSDVRTNAHNNKA